MCRKGPGCPGAVRGVAGAGQHAESTDLEAESGDRFAPGKAAIARRVNPGGKRPPVSRRLIQRGRSDGSGLRLGGPGQTARVSPRAPWMLLAYNPVAASSGRRWPGAFLLLAVRRARRWRSNGSRGGLPRMSAQVARPVAHGTRVANSIRAPVVPRHRDLPRIWRAFGRWPPV
jgi:hypothetical protein